MRQLLLGLPILICLAGRKSGKNMSKAQKMVGFIADNVLYYTLNRYSYNVTVQNRYVMTCK